MPSQRPPRNNDDDQQHSDLEAPRRRTRDGRYDQDRRRHGHRATSSHDPLLSRNVAESPPSRRKATRDSTPASRDHGQPLSFDSLARLEAVHAHSGWGAPRVKDEDDRRRKADHARRKSGGAHYERHVDKRGSKPARREQSTRGYDENVVTEDNSGGIVPGGDQRGKHRRNHYTKQDGRKEEDRLKEESSRQQRKKRQRPDDLSEEGEGREYRNRTGNQERRPPRKDRRHTSYNYPEDSIESPTQDSRLLEEKTRRTHGHKSRTGDRGVNAITKTKQRGGGRVTSGQLLEKGRPKDFYDDSSDEGFLKGGFLQKLRRHDWRKARWKRWAMIAAGVISAILLITVIAVVVSQKKAAENGSNGSAAKPGNSNLAGVDPNSIPASAKGGYLDPFTWYDTEDFNLTYTDATVGGLSLMGLNSTWDDNVQANSNVPPLKDDYQYGTMPIRGMNVGGWLSIEPFITPSFFQRFNSRDSVIDEYTLCSKLGSNQATAMLEKHYSSFVTANTFSEIRAAGFDHVRIPFSYWAVTVYDGDPYVPLISWRYLLRAIEWARQNGLRVNLDLHALPGSQNGWNHSGRQGYVGWLNGTDGDLNGQRSLDIHRQLSTFFGQPRYRNIVTMYGLANEPRMTGLDTSKVLAWTTTAINIVRSNNVTAVIVFGDGFMGLDKWQGKLQSDSRLLLDVHQYVIFNNDQLKLPHTDKITFACDGWTQQMKRSSDRKTGFGPTMCGEWSQADTDCAPYLNNVGVGSRWQGTLNTGNATTSVLDPQCPTKNSPTCECSDANADAGAYTSAYRDWLRKFAEAQMYSFEQGWGWFYWTWDTENAVQWSWKKGMAAGILPTDIRQRSFTCGNTVPDYAGMGLAENY